MRSTTEAVVAAEAAVAAATAAKLNLIPLMILFELALARRLKCQSFCSQTRLKRRPAVHRRHLLVNLRDCLSTWPTGRQVGLPGVPAARSALLAVFAFGPRHAHFVPMGATVICANNRREGSSWSSWSSSAI